MKAKTTIIIGVALILISILLFFLSPLFVPYCGHILIACADAVTGKEVNCFEDSFPSIFNVNCVDFYRNLASILFIIGIGFIIAGLIETRNNKKKRKKLKMRRKNNFNMNKTSKIVLILVSVIVIFILAISVYDIYGEWHMKKFAKRCGSLSTAGTEMICGCDGKMVNDNSQLNPLLRKTGGVNYYCYGECMECKCYRGFRDNKIEIDC